MFSFVFYFQRPGFKGSFSDRSIVLNYLIRIIAYMEGLDHRLNIAMYYDKELVSFIIPI